MEEKEITVFELRKNDNKRERELLDSHPYTRQERRRVEGCGDHEKEASVKRA